MGNEGEVLIKITGDASSLVAASQQTNQSLESNKIKLSELTPEQKALTQAQTKTSEVTKEASTVAEKHIGHLQGMHRVFHALNEVVPGLGVLMQAAFSPVGAAISMALIVLRLFKEKMSETNEEFRKMEEEAARPATNRMAAWREAIVRAAEGMNHLRQALMDAARGEQTIKESTERTTAAFKEQGQQAATLAEALKEHEIAGLDEMHAAGLLSEEQYAVQRLEIEQRYQAKKLELQERAEMTEILIKKRALEQAEIAQPGLTAAAEGAELKKVAALEDLGSLDKAGVEERKKSTQEALKKWKPGLLIGNPEAIPEAFESIGMQATGQQIAQAANSTGNVNGPDFQRNYSEWAKLKAAAVGADAEWKAFPHEEAKRKVAADRAADEAARAEKAAVGNQDFATGTGREIGEQRSRFDAHHAADQELGGLQQDTSVLQAVARARESVKKDNEALLNAMEHSVGLGAAFLRKVEEHAKTLGDMENRLRHQESRPPPI
jgi:hypothetical protein